MNEKEFRGNDVDEMIFGCQEQVISSERWSEGTPSAAEKMVAL